MSLYIQSQNTGELWLRNSIGKIESANELLSAIYLKYSDIPESNSFYNELNSNQITRFDIFYDCIFIETKSGCFFEKIDVNENRSLIPYTKTYFFNSKKTTQIDYWLNEYHQKVYFTDINFVTISGPTFTFDVSLKEFDCQSGNTTLKMNERVELHFSTVETWFDFVPVIENPKLTYNNDTKTFNISFVFRSKTGQFALLSLMIKSEETYKISKIDGIVPFATLDHNLSKNYSLIGYTEMASFFSLASFLEEQTSVPEE
jgi:hypothetical protein